MAQTLVLHTGALSRHPRAQAPRRFRLDPGRIGAQAGAMAINAAALLLLLAPLGPHQPPAIERHEETWVIPIAPPRPPAPVREVEVERPRPRLAPVVAPTTIVPPRPEVRPPVVVPMPGDLPAQPEVIADARTEPATGLTKPLAGARLEYAAAPPPPYPLQALRAGLTGTVTLRVLVDVDGRPLEVSIERSSGHRVLDAAARKQVLARWRFRPAMQDGLAVQAIGLVPVVFDLDR